MRKTINDNLLLTSSRFIKQKEYWVAKLPGGIGETGLLFAGGTQNGLKKEIKTVDIEMDEHLSGRLKKLSKESDISLYILLLAGLKLLVYRYGCGGNSDIDNSEIDIISPVYKPNVTGDTFNDFLFIRNRVGGSLTVKELILRVRESVLGAYDNQDFPFEKLLGFLAETRGKTVDTHRSEIECRLKNIHAAGNIEPVNSRLVFSFEKENHRVRGTIFYNPGIYEDYYIQQVAGHFITVLRNSLEDVNINISEVPLLSKQEKQRLLFDLNNTTAEYPGDKTLHGLFEEQARETPDAVALAGPVTGTAFPHAPGNRGRQIQHLTYRALNDLADRSARTFREKGAAPDVIMAVTVERSIETLINILAILKAGGAYLPIDPGLPPGRIRYLLADSGAEMPAAAGTTAKKGGAPRAPRPVIPGNLAYVIYTSGSTGRPKGVLVEHFSAVNLVLDRKHRFEIDATDRVLQFSSLSFDASVEQVFVALSSGAALILVDEETLLDTLKFDAYIRRQVVTHLDSVPSFLSNIPFKDPGFYSLKRIVSGGEICPISLAEKLGRYCDFYNAYGPTETTVTAVGMKYRPGNGRLPGLPIGSPIRNTAVYLFDRWKAPVPTAVPGEMYIGGAGVTRGYLNRPELTSETFLPNPPAGGGRLYRTGDLARWLPDDNIEFLGRIDRQVKIRGLRIELGEIEKRLLDHEKVKETVVLDREGKDGEKYLCAYIVNPEGEQKTLDIPALREYLLHTLPVYMIPTYFVLIDKIPLTPNGKIDRKTLPEPEVKIHREYAAPGNETEEKLAAIWSEILGIEKGIISIHSSFFELGGHSLRATILAAKIHKELNVKIPLVEIFKMPTIRELSGYIKGAVKDKHAAIEPVEKKEYYHLSSAQKRLYIVQQMNTAGTTYNLPALLSFEGPSDKERLEDTFKKLIDRHESFRTSFELTGNLPVQRIHDEIEFSIVKYQVFSETEKTGIKQITDNFIRPFDLGRAPLLRVEVLDIGESKHILMIDMHHIISDGTSIEVLKRDISVLYAGDRLGPPRLQYKDFADWQNELFNSHRVKQQEDYWRRVYPGEIPTLNLPTDYPRPGVFSFKGDCYEFTLNREHVAQLNAFCKNNDVTPYMILLAAFNVLLSKYTGQDDIVVGTSIAGRPHADLQEVVGMFVNMLAVRNFPRGHKTFNEFINEVRTHSLDAFENQDVQFEELVDKLGLERDTSRNPLFDVTLSVQNHGKPKEVPPVKEYQREIEKLKFSEKNLLFLEHENTVSRFDLSLMFFVDGGDIHVRIEYYTGVFRKETVERMTAHFKNIFRAVIQEPSVKLDDIEIMSREERERILNAFNRTAIDYPENKTIPELFEDRVERTPDTVALTGPVGMPAVAPGIAAMSMTYGELNRKSDQLAFLLIEKGVGPDTVVGFMAHRSIEMIIGILAILKAGGAYLPIDPGLPGERVDYMLKDSRAGVLAVTGTPVKERENVRRWDCETIFLEETAFPGAHHAPCPMRRANPKNLAYVIYTSGSTGKPKGVLIEHRSAINLAFAQKKTFNIDESEKVLQFSPFYFDASVEQIFTALFSGASLVLVDNATLMDIDAFEEYISRHCVTHLHAVPSFLKNIREKDSYSLRRVASGGDVCPPSLARKWSKRCDFYNKYGPTETTVTSIQSSIKHADESRGVVSIGKPMDNTTVYILDRRMKPLPPGAAGEIYIGGAGVTRGYLNRPELTSVSYLPDPFLEGGRLFRTGDLARWLPDDNIEFFGRIDRQVKIRGLRIEPGEIESRLSNHKKVKETVVLDREGKDGEKYLCAYIVGPGGEQKTPLDIPALRKYLSQTLPGYMIPSYFVSIDKIPLTTNGKINRKELPEPAADTGKKYVPPGDKSEKKLASLWSEVLGIEKEKISIDDDFFELGGHSLKATILAAKIHEELNVKISLVDIFGIPTIRGFSAYIKETAKDKYFAVESVEKKEYYPLSSAQKRLYALHHMETDSTYYNSPMIVLLEGKLERKKIETVLRKLIERHGSFRTSFEMIGNEPFQAIHKEVDFEVAYYDNVPEEEEPKIIEGFMKPFDLTRPPLLRIGILQKSEDKYVFMIDVHHIITDGTSMIVFRKEFQALYEGEELPPLKFQYKDYSEWHTKLMRSEEMKKQENYWMKQLEGENPIIDLPTDFPRPPVQSTDGDLIPFEIGGDLYEKIERLAVKPGITVYIVLLSAYTLLLSKLSEQEDIVVGTPIAGRTHSDLQNIMGFFINMLVMRNQPKGDKTYNEFLMEVKENALKAYENQDYPFEVLVEKLNFERKSGRHVLIDAVIVLHNQNEPISEFGIITEDKNRNEDSKLEIKEYESKLKKAPFTLCMDGLEFEKKLVMRLIYATGLFKRSTAVKLTELYIEILEQVAADRETPLLLRDIEISGNFLAAESKIPARIEFGF